MNQILVAIRTCPQRDAVLAALIQEIELTDIFLDDVIILREPEDADPHDHWKKEFKRILERVKESGQMLLLLEDDVHLNLHILHNVSTWQGLNEPLFGVGWLCVPDRVASQHCELGERHTTRYRNVPETHNAGAILFSPQGVLAMLVEMNDSVPCGELKTDLYVSRAMSNRGLRLYLHTPSLAYVDHSIPSLLGHDDAPRSTSYFIHNFRRSAERATLPLPRFRGRRFVGGVATIPSRQYALSKMLLSILPQLHEILIVLNGYRIVPEWLNRLMKLWPGIMRISLSESNLGDAAKFICDSGKEDIFFTFDDDIIYPKNYTVTMACELLATNALAVGVHGYDLEEQKLLIEDNFFAARLKVYHFEESLSLTRKVNVLGTGTAAFLGERRPSYGIDFFDKNMADIHTFVWASSQESEGDSSFACVRRPARWLRCVEGIRESIYKSNPSKGIRQRELYLEVLKKRKSLSQPNSVEVLKISILMTAFGVEDSIERAIKSVASSIFKKTNFEVELLVGVDNSDADLDAIIEIASKIKNIKIQVFSAIENVGSYVLLNSLFSKAEGQLIGILDGDDAVTITAFDDLIEEILNRPGLEFTAPKMRQFDCEWKEVKTPPVYQKQIKDCLSEFFKGRHCWPIHSSRVMTRRVFHAMGGYRRARFGADWDFALRAYSWGLNASVCDVFGLERGKRAVQATNHPNHGLGTPARVREGDRQNFEGSMAKMGARIPAQVEMPTVEITRVNIERAPLIERACRVYWTSRYKSGRNSGGGSYGLEAEWKGQVIAGVIGEQEGVSRVLDVGCGDGNLRELFLEKTGPLPYIGLDDALPPESTLPCGGRRVKAGGASDEGLRVALEFEPSVILLIDVLFHVESEQERDELIRLLLECTNGALVLTAWHGDEVLKKRLATHCYHFGDVPWIDLAGDSFEVERFPVEHSEPYKEMVIMRRIRD